MFHILRFSDRAVVLLKAVLALKAVLGLKAVLAIKLAGLVRGLKLF